MFSRLENFMKDEKSRGDLPYHHRNLNLGPLAEDRVCLNRYSPMRCDTYVSEGEDYSSWCQDNDPDAYDEPAD